MGRGRPGSLGRPLAGGGAMRAREGAKPLLRCAPCAACPPSPRRRPPSPGGNPGGGGSSVRCTRAAPASTADQRRPTLSAALRTAESASTRSMLKLALLSAPSAAPPSAPPAPPPPGRSAARRGAVSVALDRGAAGAPFSLQCLRLVSCIAPGPAVAIIRRVAACGALPEMGFGLGPGASTALFGEQYGVWGAKKCSKLTILSALVSRHVFPLRWRGSPRALVV